MKSRSLSAIWQRVHGASTGGTASGLHGSALAYTEVNPAGVQLTTSTETKITISTDLTFEVGVQNSGENQEVGVKVELTIPAGDNPIEKTATIDVIDPEETKTVTFSDFPDFATFRIEYVPNERCVELKSLKLYVNSFRDVKIFHEHVVNVILEDFVRACDPLEVNIEGDFNVRGNIKTTVSARYEKQ